MVLQRDSDIGHPFRVGSIHSSFHFVEGLCLDAASTRKQAERDNHYWYCPVLHLNPSLFEAGAQGDPASNFWSLFHFFGCMGILVVGLSLLSAYKLLVFASPGWGMVVAKFGPELTFFYPDPEYLF